jgi:cytochrome c
MQVLTRHRAKHATVPFLFLVVVSVGCQHDEFKANTSSLTPANAVVASAAPTANAERGRHEMELYGCGACHQITGVRNAIGKTGPSLDTFGNRVLVAGVLVNNAENIQRWLLDPPAITPGTAMPKLGIDSATAADMAAYLQQLR